MKAKTTRALYGLWYGFNSSLRGFSLAPLANAAAFVPAMHNYGTNGTAPFVLAGAIGAAGAALGVWSQAYRGGLVVPRRGESRGDMQRRQRALIVGALAISALGLGAMWWQRDRARRRSGADRAVDRDSSVANAAASVTYSVEYAKVVAEGRVAGRRGG